MFYASLLIIVAVSLNGSCCQSLRFASYYGDHMVLQAAPEQAVIWGFASVQSIGQTVTVTIGDQTHNSIVTKGVQTGIWSVTLNPVNASSTEYSVNAYIAGDSVRITDVLFGDVWLCSGQSNMAFKISKMINGEGELRRAKHFPNVRTFIAHENRDNTPLQDLMRILADWSRPTAETLQKFSGICWGFGRRIYQNTQRPIGLIQATYLATPIENWTTNEVLLKCGVSKHRKLVNLFVGKNGDGMNWNAMIYPFLKLTIKGVLWYQGEGNAEIPAGYSCMFPELIRSWRKQFHEGSSGQTSVSFPFGFVQLAPYKQDPDIDFGFPDIRWAQTANHGYVPNIDQPDVFMAVAMDLPDFESPYGSVHTRYKTEVGRRLALGGLSRVYNIDVGRVQGPWPTSIQLEDLLIEVVFDHGLGTLVQRSTTGFEVCCSRTNVFCGTDESSIWISTPITGMKAKKGKLYLLGSVCYAGYSITGVRYAWRESPCLLKACAIYSEENDLPAPPFVIDHFFKDSRYISTQ